jgi:hypothetical protein
MAFHERRPHRLGCTGLRGLADSAAQRNATTGQGSRQVFGGCLDADNTPISISSGFGWHGDLYTVPERHYGGFRHQNARGPGRAVREQHGSSRVGRVPNARSSSGPVNLVEAGGVEPPSSSRSAQASTCLFRLLHLARAGSGERDPARTSTGAFSPTPPGAEGAGQPTHRRHSSPRRRRAG